MENLDHQELAANIEEAFVKQFKTVVALTDNCTSTYLDSIVSIFVLPAVRAEEGLIKFSLTEAPDFDLCFHRDGRIIVNARILLLYSLEEITAILVASYYRHVVGEEEILTDIPRYHRSISYALSNVGFDLSILTNIKPVIESGFQNTEPLKVFFESWRFDTALIN